MRKAIIIISFLFFGKESFCQQNESYSAIQESDLKNEIAFFVKAASKKTTDNSYKLTEIKPSRCSNDFIIFESGDLIALDKMVCIYSKPINQNATTIINNSKAWGIIKSSRMTQISEVRFLHYKYQLLLPDSAIAGLFNPKFCINPTKNNKIGKETRTNCKVYQSKDKQRVFIYMLNGEGEDQYEVTWIINKDKYYRRVVDKVEL